MALFTNINNDLVISVQNKFVVYNYVTKHVQEVSIPEINIPANLTKNQEDALKNEKVNISTCAFSSCGNYFAVTTTNKQLVVYNKDYKVLNNSNVNRTASKVRFTENGDIVAADKTGDVYLFKLKSSEMVQVLGHLSMVLDVLTTKNDKYIVTCDRDEKIRVSYFPTGYNIVSFCLGHEEFVLSLEVLDSETLISASGDGTLRLWDFVSGKQLNIVNTNDFVEDKDLINTFASQMDDETVEICALPITCMKVKLYNNVALILCSLHLYNSLLVFEVKGRSTINFLQTIKFEADIVSFDIHDKLYVLLKSGIECYSFDETFVKNNSLNNNLNDLFLYVKDFVNDCTGTENISVLYKRKFDNVQEYQERKKLRIENKK